jgi:hypothetical protein
MTRLPICTVLVLVVLASPGERIAAVYREDAVLALERTDTLA